MNKPIRIARHVYLRTQQRRLRHIKGILIRNLTLSNTYPEDPLSISVFFTVHSSSERVLFESDPVKNTYNPSWDSIQLTAHDMGHYTSFLLRVWVRFEEEESEGEGGKECSLAFEKKVELFDLSYLGIMVNKDGSSYPPNSVVVGMYEGLYGHPEVGGVLCPPRVVHTLTDYLPPQSLLEVQKKEVVDSYHQPVLTRLLHLQEELNAARRRTRLERERVEGHLSEERGVEERRRERERLFTRLKLLRAQLQELEAPEREGREQLERVTKQADEAETDMKTRQTDLMEKKESLRSAKSVFSHKRDQMQRCRRNRHLRQRHMVYELSNTFLIREREDTFTICNVILPNADQLEQPSRVEQLGVALGYVAHLIHHLGKILFIPLLYPIRPQGSKSVVCDLVSDEALIDNIKEFPLYAKGSEKALFQYAVFLLNKDIAQVRQHCGYGTSKTMFKRTLPNLKFLLDRLTRDIKSMLRVSNHTPGFHSRHHMHDSSMTASYVSVDTLSIASGSVAGSMIGSPETDSLQSFVSQTGSMYPSMYTETQQFIRHDDTGSSSCFSPQSQGSSSEQLAESIDHLLLSPYSSLHTPQPAGLTASHEETDNVEEKTFDDDDDDENGAGSELKDAAETPLAQPSTNKHTFTQPLRSVFSPPDSEERESIFSRIQRDEEREEEEEEEDCGGDSAGSTASSAPSLSTTPVVPEEFATLGASCDRFQSSSSLPAAVRSNTVETREPLPNESLTRLGSSAVSQMEETLKSAIHATQLLFKHTPPPEHTQINPAPTILDTNEAEIEAAQALSGLNAASRRALELPEDSLVEKAVENGRHESKDAPSLEGPVLIPDSFELSSLTDRQSHSDNQTNEEEDYERPQPQARMMAYSAFTLDNIGYMKTSMATPHRVSSSTQREHRYTVTGVREMSRGLEESLENGQSLADFIDGPSDTRRNSPRNRWKEDGPSQFGSRGD